MAKKQAVFHTGVYCITEAHAPLLKYSEIKFDTIMQFGDSTVA